MRYQSPRVEVMEDRLAPAAAVDVVEGFPASQTAWLESRPVHTEYQDGGHGPAATTLTIVLDFKEPGQGNTSDIFGNVVGAFDVTAYGFTAAQFNMVAAAVAAEVDEDYFAELAGTAAGPAGKDLALDFVIGDIGTPPPNGAIEFYYVQIGTGVSGPHATSFGTLGVAGGATVRTAIGADGFGANKSVVGSVFTDHINAMGGVGAALTSGDITATTHAVSGTLSHEAAHTLSLSHISKAGSVQPTAGRAPLMGTGAIDLPNADRVTDREFSLSGVDGQSDNAPREHVQQLATAVGLHASVPPPTPSGVTVNATGNPPSALFTYSRLSSLAVSFNTPVTADPGAFGITNGVHTLTSVGGGGVLVGGGGTSTLTLTFATGVAGVNFGSLSDGVWTLTTDLTKVKNLAAVAGAGAPATANIRRLYGDADGDGGVTADDFEAFGSTYGLGVGQTGYLAIFDYDLDGAITTDDFEQFGSRYGTGL